MSLNIGFKTNSQIVESVHNGWYKNIKIDPKITKNKRYREKILKLDIKDVIALLILII